MQRDDEGLEERRLLDQPGSTGSRVPILGVGVSATNMTRATADIEKWIKCGCKEYVCVADAHSILRARSDQSHARAFRNAGVVTADGAPIVWLARLLGVRDMGRIRGADLMTAVTALSADKGYRQFYYGGSEAVVSKLRARMLAAYPGLEIAGSLSPPFRPLSDAESKAHVEAINAACPDVIWVGLGAPKQERWMAENRAVIDAPVIIGVGAAFDFLSGAKRQAPAWISKLGFEWLFRICTEPSRLMGRYMHVVPAFSLLATRELARHWLHR